MSTSIQTVLIYGYGVMGRGVAKTFAGAGFTTLVKSRRAGALADLPAGVTAVERLPETTPDLVIEFVPEDPRVKQAVYAELEAAYPDGPLIASGTSGLDLVELSRKMKRRERFLGVHYFMPADVAPVVEVMAGLTTSREDVDRVADALRRTGKEPVVLYKPIVGFLVNRLQHAILHEAYYLIEAGVATVEDIDHAARRMLAPRMCLNGLIQQKDISGLKIHADAQESIVPKLFHNATPNPMLQTMVALGRTGLSAGKGFYDWSGCDAEGVRKQASSQLAKLLEFLKNGIGAPAPRTQPKRLPRS
ncbi:MAG TPA: 3-hydroxyacyl-CoA dehydrogenase NAD-binding domain-containing protein [Burkholderiales bacterium]|nr:3-hydroxyacyl-CoA dehydrogenase NAD-binding domain-containing protein [Burkholderiales bacterium]